MKKAITLGLTLLLTLSLLMACSGNGGNGATGNGSSDNGAPGNGNSVNGNSGNGNSGSGNPDSGAGAPPTSDSSGGNAPANTPPSLAQVDLDDADIYYAVIDGIKYSFAGEVTIQDLLDAGYTVDPDFDLSYEMGHGIYFGASIASSAIEMYKDGVERSYFRVNVNNLTQNPVPIRDCTIYGIYWTGQEADIYILDGFSTGSARRDLVAVLGNEGVESKVAGFTDWYSIGYILSSPSRGITFNYKESTDVVMSISIFYELSLSR